MQPARPLRDIFDEVARGDLGADPAETLADGGHGDLPDQLVSEAIVSYADTAPIEVAEHLAPFVTAHSPVVAGAAEAGGGPAGDGLDLLAAAPEPILADSDPTGGDPTGGDPTDEILAEVDPLAPSPAADALDFGFGSGAADPTAALDLSTEDAEPIGQAPVPADEPPAPADSDAELAEPWLAPPATAGDEEPAGGGDDGEDGDPIG